MLNWQAVEHTFSKGLNQKADPRLIGEPELVIARDVEFDDIGGLRLRYPYASIGSNIFGGGTISDCRRIYAVGSELILFTSTAMYSWSSQHSAWVLKGTHLAVKVEEEAVFITNGDQTQCDRAELNGTVFYTWTDGASLVSPSIYVAATDASSGAVLMAPTVIVTAQRPRLVACSTRVLLFYMSATATDLYVDSLNPASPSIGAATTIRATTANFYYDAVRSLGTPASALVALRRNATTSYEVARIAEAGTITAASTKARTCTGAIAVCDAPTGEVQVVRANGTNVQGDQLTSGLVDTFTAQAIGTTAANPASNIAACFRSVQTSGTYRCYCFWSSDETTGGASDWQSRFNYVTVANGVGSQETFVRRLAVASRAFDHNGSVYVHGAFFGASEFVSVSSLFGTKVGLQNTLFLYRDDATLHAKIAMARQAGVLPSGHLPGVALTAGSTGYSFCATERRRIPLDRGARYSDGGPRDVTITFDSDEARRVAKLGPTAYVTGGEILQYDGERLTEVGFHVAPFYISIAELAGGTIATNGEYAYCGTYRWDNARGERDRSWYPVLGSGPIASQPGSWNIVDAVPLYITHKTNRPVAMEWWRTVVNPTFDSPLYLATGIDPATTTGSNCYIANDTSLSDFADFVDDFADSVLTTKEPLAEVGPVLENLAPPAATIIAASADRLFLAGVAGDPHRVWYSKLHEDGRVAAFNDGLTVAVPEVGGDITGLALFERIPIVFRETAIYALDGMGVDNTASGQNYEARLISPDCGAVSQESIVQMPMGLMFKAAKGWYVLKAPQFGAVEYIGAPVVDYDSETVHAAHVVESQHQVRIVTSGRVLMFDYNVGNWAEWSVSDGLHACMWNGAHHVLATAAVRGQSTSYATADYGWDVEMLIHPGSLQGFARCQEIQVLGEVRGAGSIRLRLGSYAEGSYFDDKTWTISPTTVGAELAFRHGPSQQQHKAYRIRLTSHATAGEKPKLSVLSLKVGQKGATYRHLPAAQKQ